jgi:pentose-5-phosphate-3-epimerase
MSVEPGFGGQLFDQSAINKIAFLKEEKGNGG